jgi:cytochrome P450
MKATVMSHEPAPSETAMNSNFRSVSDTYDGTGVTNPFPLYAELARTNPVMEGDILARFGVPSQADYGNKGRKVFTIFRNEDVMSIMRDPETWTSNLLMDGLGAFLGDVMLTALDGPAHKRLRNLIAPCFGRQVLQRWNEQLILPIIRGEYVENMRPRGRAELVHDFALPFPVRVIYAILGFPADRESIERFAGWALRILAGPQKDPEKAKAAIQGAFQAAQELYDHVRPIVEQRRAEGAVGDDMIAYLLRAEHEGQRLDDHQVTNLVRMMLPAAAETTTRTFANTMVLLFDHPETLERVRRDRSLVRAALNESMRYEPVAAFHARQAARDVTIRGVTIPAGAAVSVCAASANRDVDIYNDPDVFDIDRAPRPVLGFGYGVHTCLGMQVAQMEMDAALDALLDLPNLRLDPDKPRPQIRGMQLRGPDAIHVVWD